ncbi:MAG: hypothetical protein D6731_07915 [Planctomycetota bacterium]|nr:MAG: hypothetical protein D6731_07915 [Planctomycetota bacterium]
MIRSGPAAAFVLAAFCAAPALGQGLAGVYRVDGSEPGRGAYRGRAELRWTGSGYAFVREVEYASYRYRGRPVSTVWRGVARDRGSGALLEIELDRMGWASAAPGISLRRGPADARPLRVVGDLRPQGAVLRVSYRGPGAPFVDRAEDWRLLGAPGPRPIWSPDRRLVPLHRVPTPLEKRLLFLLFRSFHDLPWVRPYVARPEFRAAVHYALEDRTDFALHRRRPDLLRVEGRILDDLALEEAAVKAAAFGPTLLEKARRADAEVPARFLDPSGALAVRDAAGGLQADGDGALWTGAYAYAQRLRWQVTGDLAARDLLERAAGSLRVCMEITGRSDTFARTVRTARGLPLGSLWAAGQGPYAGLEWLRGGNNDMFSGIVLGGLAVAEGLPAGHPLRTNYGRSMRDLVASSPVVRRHRGLAVNELMGSGVVSLLLGPGPERQRYEQLARNPFQLIYNAAVEGGLFYQGIADWSGTHLAVVSLIVQLRLAEHHGQNLVRRANQLGLRRAARRLGRARRTLHILAAAGLAGLPAGGPVRAEDAIWDLRELPVPRSRLTEHHLLRADVSLGPYPVLPWKFDWRTSRNRASGLVVPPLFETFSWNYVWKDSPFPQIDAFGTSWEYNSADYLFAYWLGRATGVIDPTD